MIDRTEPSSSRTLSSKGPVLRVWRRVLRGSAARWMLLPAMLLPGAGSAQTLLDASYDAGSNRLVLEIAYRGTHPDHQFVLEWGPCKRSGEGSATTIARLIDSHGQDSAHQDYRVLRHFDLAGLECRPAEVTIRLGPVSNRTAYVPASPR